MEEAPKKYFRLAPGKQVRLKSAYIIRCDEVIKDDEGNILQLNCSYFPNSKSGEDSSGIHVKGTLHWVNAKDCFPVQINEYDRLFTVEDPSGEEGDFTGYINKESLKIIEGALAEPALKNAVVHDRFQFLRKGYFTLDPDSTPAHFIFNRTVTLKDSWAKAGK